MLVFLFQVFDRKVICLEFGKNFSLLFLDKNKLCSIYAIRPKDCQQFPYHYKKDTIEYIETFKQNLEYCPATFLPVECCSENVHCRPWCRDKAAACPSFDPRM